MLHPILWRDAQCSFPLQGGRDALFSRLLVWKYKFQDDKRS
jgi:hypothetical protein